MSTTMSGTTADEIYVTRFEAPYVHKLPPAAREKLKDLGARWESMSDAVHGMSHRHRAAQRVVIDLRRKQSDEQGALADYLRGSIRAEGDQYGAKLEQAAKRAEDNLAAGIVDVAKRKAEVDASAPATNALGNALSAANDYLAGLGFGAMLSDVAVVPVKLRGDGTDQLAAARNTIAHLIGERDAVLHAPQDAAAADAMLATEVQRLAALGRPVLSLVATRGGVTWPETATASGVVADVPQLLAWLDPDKMLARLREEYRRTVAERGDEPGLPLDARMAKVEEIAAAILAAEHAEEAIVGAMERATARVVRRHDADPRAILGVFGPPSAVTRAAMTI